MKAWFESRKEAFKKANWWDKSQPILTVIMMVIYVGVNWALVPILGYVLFLELQELHYRQSYEELKDSLEEN